MKILVIGGNGQLGSALMQVLEIYHDVIGTKLIGEEKNLIQLDITEKNKVKQILDEISPDIVINTAALTHVDRCETEKELAEKINIKGNTNLAEWCFLNNKKLVFISSYYVFDGKNTWYSEEDKVNPLNVYSETKINSETITLKNPNNIIIRTSKIYSFGKDNRNFIARVIDDLKQKKEFITTNDQYNNPLSSHDCALCIKKLIDENASGIYNVGGPDYYNNVELASVAADVFKLDKKLIIGKSTEEFKADALRPKKCGLIVKKLFDKTGFTPKSVKENLIEWNNMKTKEELEIEILDKIQEYHDVVHKDKTFFPGVSKLNYAGRVFDAEEMKAMTKSLLDFTLTYGKYGIEFEKQFAKFNNKKYSVLTNSGSSANLLAVTSLCSYKIKNHLKPGDEVITPVCTFPTTLNPIIQNNLVPVFLDVELGTYNMDLTNLEKAYSPKTRAVMIPHTLGNPNNMDKIMKFVKKHDLFLIEDCCDALDSTYDNKKMGTFGQVATVSFFPAHHMTMGEGGLVMMDDPMLNITVKSIRDWGRACWCEPGKSDTCGRRFEHEIAGMKYDHKYIYDNIGYNLKPLDLQAAMGLVQLKKLPEFTKARKHNFNELYKFFEKYEKWFILPRAEEKAEPSWFAFPLTVKDNVPFSKLELVKYLEDNKIETRPLFAGNILEHPGYKNNDFKYRIVGEIKNSDKILKDTFFIGVYPGIDEKRMSFMKKVLNGFLEKW